MHIFWYDSIGLEFLRHDMSTTIIDIYVWVNSELKFTTENTLEKKFSRLSKQDLQANTEHCYKEQGISETFKWLSLRQFDLPFQRRTICSRLTTDLEHHFCFATRKRGMCVLPTAKVQFNYYTTSFRKQKSNWLVTIFDEYQRIWPW